MNVKYNMSFNKDEWKIKSVSFKTQVTQHFLPAIPFSLVKMPVSLHIVSINPAGDASLGTKTLEWGPLSSGTEMTFQGSANLSLATPPQTAFFMFYHRIIYPYPPATEQTATILDTLDVVFESVVANPTNNPTGGNTIESNTPPPDNPFGGFFGGLSTGVIVAGAVVLGLILLSGNSRPNPVRIIRGS